MKFKLPMPWWSKKKIDEFWMEYYEPWIAQEIDMALALDGRRFLLHKLKDNITWEEIDGL